MSAVLDQLLEKTRDLKVRVGAFAEWDESKHPRAPAGSDKGGEFASVFELPETDDELTPEIIARLPAEAQTNEGADHFFISKLRALSDSRGVVMYHESPGDVRDSMLRTGIRSGYGIFARVGEPSGYVTSDVKTVVKFYLPKNEITRDNIGPDMRYTWSEKLSPSQILLLAHPTVKGADVSINHWERLPKKNIIDVTVVKRGDPGYRVLATADEHGRVTPSTAIVQARSRVFHLSGSPTPVLAYADAAGHVYAEWNESKHPRDEEGRWSNNGVELDSVFFHAPTKGDFDEPSVDIGSDYDVMGRGFYFGTAPEASFYGAPKQFHVKGKFATGEQWVSALRPHLKQDTAVGRQQARAALQAQGYSGVWNDRIGVVWDQAAIKNFAFDESIQVRNDKGHFQGIRHPLYVSRHVENAEEIIVWAKSVGFETTLPAEDMHVTVCYSKEPVDWLSLDHWVDTLEIPPEGVRTLAVNDDGEDGVWRTVRGRHVFIREGDTVSESIRQWKIDVDNAIDDYGSYGYEDVNKSLRGKATWSKDSRDLLKKIESAFSDPEFYSVTKSASVAYRGVSDVKIAKQFIGAKVGQVFSDKAFLSTSANLKGVLEMHGGVLAQPWPMKVDQFFLKIEVPKGTRYLTPNKGSDEAERLFYHDSKLKVIGVVVTKIKDKDFPEEGVTNRTVVTVRLLPGKIVKTKVLAQGEEDIVDEKDVIDIDLDGDGKMIGWYADRTLTRLGEDGAVVLQFESAPLTARHQYFLDHGASWDYDAYHPHITLTYDKPEGLVLSTVEPYTGKIVLGPEQFTELETGWVEADVDETSSVKEHADQSTFTTIDYAQIEKDLDAMEAKFKDELRAVLIESRDAVLATVKRKGTLPRDFTLPHTKDIQNVIGGALQRAMDRGGADAGKEIGRAKRETKVHSYAKVPSFSPKAALKWLREKIFWVADVLTTGLTEDIRSVILNGLKTGKPNSEIITDIAQKYIPYLGDPTAVKDGELPTAARLETVVRTNITESYNQGRIATFVRPDMMPFLDGIQYSSILDTRTTPVCRYLGTQGGKSTTSGFIFRPEEIQATGLVPGNHFQCRSLVVPVPVGVISKPPDYKVDPKVYITPAEIEYARSLADVKFLEQSDDVHEHAEEEGVWRTVRGRHVFIREGETPAQAVKRSIAERSARSSKHHIPATKAKQDQAAKYEETVAKLIGGKNLDDHEPFDVIKGRHAVEVKTVLLGAKSVKVTMHPDSLMRKANFLRDEKMTGHTVVIDAREEKPAYYYKVGVGSFRLSNMQVVKAAELKGLIS